MARKKLIDNELLSEMTGKEVCWHEIAIPMYVRVHYDRERYLSDYQDIPISKVNKYLDRYNMKQELKEQSYYWYKQGLTSYLKPHMIKSAVIIVFIAILSLIIGLN